MQWPDIPWRIPDTTPVPERKAILRMLVEEAKSDPVVRQFAQAICATAPDSSNQMQFAVWILHVVQCRVPYVPDPPGEWFQKARYTIARGGDCEDKTVLLLAVYELLGYGPTAIVWQVQDGAPLDHVTGILTIDGVGMWADASICGAHLGEEPHDAARRVGNTHVLGPQQKAA